MQLIKDRDNMLARSLVVHIVPSYMSLLTPYLKFTGDSHVFQILNYGVILPYEGKEVVLSRTELASPGDASQCYFKPHTCNSTCDDIHVIRKVDELLGATFRVTRSELKLLLHGIVPDGAIAPRWPYEP